MITEINTRTAAQWLKDHYKDVPGIWEQFDINAASNSLAETMIDISTEMCGNEPIILGMDVGKGCEVCGHRYWAMEHWWKGDYDDLPELDLIRIMADARMRPSFVTPK